MKEPIISVSGLRGIIGESLSPDLALRFAAAFVSGLEEGPVVVTRDGRTTGSMLATAVQAGIQACGRSVLAGDVAATPTTGVLVRQHQAAGGVQISASHNPLPYNGLKLFNREGQVISAERGDQVIERFRASAIDWCDHSRVGALERLEDTTSAHLSKVLATVDVDRIRDRRYQVLLDSNHGAGSLLGRRLLDELGCTVTLLGDTPDGRFAHLPEPTATNLAGVLDHVKNSGAVVGFCQDPDADRLAIIDEQGHYIGEEFTLALCLQHVLQQAPGRVVINCATSRMAQDLAERWNCELIRSAVGEANVVAEMQTRQAVFGGEGNGGPIDPRVGFVRDSFVGMALVLDAMAATGQGIRQLVQQIPHYAIHKTKVDLDREQIAPALERLVASYPGVESNQMDGLRFDWPDRWLLVRASNTEPIVRVIAEAPTAEEAEEMCEQAKTELATG